MTPTVFSGSIPASLPGAANVTIAGTISGNQYTFTSSTLGSWSVLKGLPADQGTAGSWALAPSGVPEPSTIALAVAGFAALAIRRRQISR